MNLHRGRLRAKAQAVGRVEGVLRRARGVKLRDVERREVVEVRLDLWAVLDGIAHRDEDVLDALAQERYRVEMPTARASSGQRHVKALALLFQQADMNEKRAFCLVQPVNDGVVKFLHALAERGALI